MRSIITAINLGRMSYSSALSVQHKHVAMTINSVERANDSTTRNNLLLVEHSPVYTVGLRMGDYDQDEARLRALGADFHRTDRGGLITFHGPGQLVAYPILLLSDFNLTMKKYIASLEQVLINTCQTFGVSSQTCPDTGVWCGNNKIAAIGVHNRRHVVSHGVALNCDTDLRWFSHIVACGLVGKGVTSLSQELGRRVTIQDATQPFLEAFSEEFNCDVVKDES